MPDNPNSIPKSTLASCMALHKLMCERLSFLIGEVHSWLMEEL